MLNRATAAALIVGLALAGCASTPTSHTTPATARNAPATTCVGTPTGLLAPPRDCAGSGHTWTQHQIERTGAPTTAGALRLLDPTVTVTGN